MKLMISLIELAPVVIIYADCKSTGKWSKQQPVWKECPFLISSGSPSPIPILKHPRGSHYNISYPIAFLWFYEFYEIMWWFHLAMKGTRINILSTAAMLLIVTLTRAEKMNHLRWQYQHRNYHNGCNWLFLGHSFTCLGHSGHERLYGWTASEMYVAPRISKTATDCLKC